MPCHDSPIESPSIPEDYVVGVPWILWYTVKGCNIFLSRVLSNRKSVMKRYAMVLLLLVLISGCKNQGIRDSGSSSEEHGVTHTEMRESSQSAEDKKTFDDRLAKAIEQYGRFRVIELRVLDPPRGSDVQELYHEVRLLRRSVDVPDAHGEIEDGVGRFIIAPLADIQFCASRIDFGTLLKVDRQQRVVTVRW